MLSKNPFIQSYKEAREIRKPLSDAIRSILLELFQSTQAQLLPQFIESLTIQDNNNDLEEIDSSISVTDNNNCDTISTLLQELYILPKSPSIPMLIALIETSLPKTQGLSKELLDYILNDIKS